MLSELGCRLAGLNLIPRAGQDRDALFRELTRCLQTDAFVGAGNQGNFLECSYRWGMFAFYG
jgi:hypothetical protein